MTIHLTRQISSERLDLPELKPFLGKHVQITIQEVVSTPDVGKWQALADIGGADLIDPDVVTQYRKFEAGLMEAGHDPR